MAECCGERLRAAILAGEARDGGMYLCQQLVTIQQPDICEALIDRKREGSGEILLPSICICLSSIKRGSLARVWSGGWVDRLMCWLVSAPVKVAALACESGVGNGGFLGARV